MKRSRWHVRSAFLATITFSVVLIGSILLPDRAVAATADVASDSQTIDQGKTALPKTVLGDEPIRADAVQAPGSNPAAPLFNPREWTSPGFLRTRHRHRAHLRAAMAWTVLFPRRCRSRAEPGN